MQRGATPVVSGALADERRLRFVRPHVERGDEPCRALKPSPSIRYTLPVKPLGVLACLVLSVCPAAAVDLDIASYDIEARLDQETCRLTGTETVRWRNAASVATSELWFHLYLNAFSLAVLHHEVAHGSLFLGSFDPEPLKGRTFEDEKDLSKAFFAGYTAIPPFLHEGIGDYALYYHGLYAFWPVLPAPKDILVSLRAAGGFIPLEKLIKESRIFRMRNHKAYSLEAASFIDYCLRAFGPEKLKAWFMDAGSRPDQTFEAVYGMTVAQAEALWLKDLGMSE